MLTVENAEDIDWINIPLSKCALGNCWDTYFTLRLFETLQDKLSKLNVDKVCEHIMVPAMNMFTRMELKGMLISTEILEKLGKEILHKKTEFEDSFYSFNAIKKTFSIDKDIVKILYSCEWDKTTKTWEQKQNEYGFGLYPPDRTEKGSDPSTSAETLETILRQVQEEIDERDLDEKK